MDDDNGSINNVDVRKLELFTIVMIKTLRRSNKKCEKKKLYFMDCEKKLRKF